MPSARTLSVLSTAVALCTALTFVAPVSASAEPAPVLALPASVDFGTTPYAHAVTRVVEVGVGGDTAVTFGATLVATPTASPQPGGEFPVGDDTCSGATVQPGEACTVHVAFRPYYTGSREGTLLVRDGAGSTIGTVALTGVGTEDAEGTYYKTTPTRLLDTRKAGTRAALAGGSTTKVQLGGRTGIPTTGVSAVVVNLTAVQTTSEGYFTAYPSDRKRPTASSINFPKGWTGAVMATVPVGADGAIKLYNYGGAAHAIVDVLGWYAVDNSVQAAKGMGTMLFDFYEPGRMFDSRRDGGSLAGGDAVELGVDWGSDEDNDVVTSWLLNITAVGATRPGVVTAWSGQGSKPTVSTLNYEPGVVAPNMAVVTSGHAAEGTFFRLDNVGAGRVHLVVDVVGVMLSGQDVGLRFVRLDTPTRFLDTRLGLGLKGAFGSHATRTVDARTVAPGPVGPVVATVTGVKPSLRTYLSVQSAGSVEPVSTSSLNVEKGVVRSASAYLPAQARVYNDAGPMHLVMDAVGVFYPYDLVNGGCPVGVQCLKAPEREPTTTNRFGSLPDTVIATRR